MQTNPEQWAKDLFWAALKAGDHNNYEAAYAVIQAAFAEQNALHTAMEKRARDLSVMLVNHLGGGSEWFSQIGEEYYADPKAIDPELQRRKTDAQITKCALVRANKAIADQAEQNARLVEAFQEYRSQFGQALEAHSIPYGDAQQAAEDKARQALAALKDRT